MDEGSSVIYETLVSPTDLTPVLDALEVMQQSLDQVNAGLEQLHADVSLVLLAVVQLHVVSLEILDAVPEVVGLGMTSACFVVLVAGLLVGCFKALIKIMGR